MQTLTGFDAALKDVYGPRIEEQLSIANVLTDWIDTNDAAEWTGRRVVYPIHVGRNEGVGANAEGEPLPDATHQDFASVAIPERYNYGRIQLTMQAIKSSTTNKGAFARAMENEMTGLVRDLGNDRERQSFGAGSGVLCLAAAAATNVATLSIDSPFGVTPTTNGGRFIKPGHSYIAIDPATDTVIEDTFTVTTAWTDPDILTMTAAVTITNNARIVHWSSPTLDPGGIFSPLGHEVTGLLGLIDNGTYVRTLHGIDRVVWPIFRSTVFAGAGALSLDLIQRGVDAIDELGGGNFGQNGVMFCHHSVRREYLKLLQADRRYTGADLGKPDGGTRNAAVGKAGIITYGDRPMLTAKHCPYGTLFGFLKDSIVRYVHVKGEWADEDGAILARITGYDIYEAYYRIFDELHTDRPNDGFRIDGITATLGTPNKIF